MGEFQAPALGATNSSRVYHNHPSAAKRPQQPTPPRFYKETQFPQSTNHSLRDKAFNKLNEWEGKLNDWHPPFAFQSAYDCIVKEIDRTFSSPDSSWAQFNQRLDDLGHGSWHSQLANFLVRLPAKVARNIIRILGNIISIAIRVPLGIAIHPLKAPLQLAKLLVALIHALTQPETWTKIGAGVLGNSLAATTITGNPLSLIGVGIGAALSIAGISVGTLKTALLAQEGKKWTASKHYLAKQALVFTEDLLTSYCMGMLFAAIQKIVRACQRARHNSQHRRNVDRVQAQNNQAVADVNRTNQNRIIASQNQHTELQKQEFLANNNLPQPEVSSQDGLNFSVRWRIERAANGNIPLADLPEGKFVIENLQTGVESIRTDFWVEGYVTYSSYDVQVYDATIDAYVWVSEPYLDWVPGYWDYTITHHPIIEKFCGFDVNTAKYWISPELLPQPIPLPLPIKPPFPPAFNVPSSCIKACAAIPVTNDFVAKTQEAINNREDEE